MKRPKGFTNECSVYLDIALWELQVLVGDDEHLLPMTVSLMQCEACGLPASNGDEADIFIDSDQCIYLVSGCSYCGVGPATAYLDTSDMPEWQETLLYLLRMQMGLNSLGDE